jgi:hypothetical protein
MDFDVFKARKVRREETADGPTTNDANLHAHAVLKTSVPE